MMLKVNGEFLDFDDEIDVDRKVKLFEEIDATAGDFSYSFNIPKTSRNLSILGFPLPDNADKTVYQTNEAEIIGDDGLSLFIGSLRVEIPLDTEIQCSFFSGNSNWFAMLTGSLRDLQGESVIMTEANIRSSWTNTEGVIFPLVDTGMLAMRNHERLTVEDFHPFLFVKTLVKTIFQKYSIKLEGELLSDWLYNNVILSSGVNQGDQIQSLRTFAQKTAATAVDNTSIAIPFENVTNPYFSTAQYNPASGEYSAPYDMVVRVKATVNFSDISDLYQLNIYRNSQPLSRKIAYSQTGEASATIEYDILLESGDNMTVNAEVRNAGGTANAIGGSLDITPLYILNLSGYSEFLPDWTEGELVSNVFSMFNVISKYDPVSKTLTANLFNKLKDKPPIDISSFSRVVETDYAEFISNYARNNKLTYDADPEEYGMGNITSDNDYIEEEMDLVESDFKTNPPIRSVAFKAQLEKMEFRESYTYIDTDITSVTDNSGTARFNVSSTSLMSVGNLIRIETDNDTYTGDYVIGVVGVGFFEVNNLSFVANDTGTAERILQVPVSNDDCHLLVLVKNLAISSFSDIGTYYFYNSSFVAMAYAYFNLYNEGRVINNTYVQSLFFGSDGKDNFYQRTIIDTFWSSFSSIINDPVKERVEANLPWKIHNDIDFLRPIMIRTLETTNLYYLNLERGYKNSSTPTELELIKLP